MAQIAPANGSLRGKERAQSSFPQISRAVNHSAARDNAPRLPALRSQSFHGIGHRKTLNNDAAHQGRAQLLQSAFGNFYGEESMAPGQAVIQRRGKILTPRALCKR